MCVYIYIVCVCVRECASVCVCLIYYVRESVCVCASECVCLMSLDRVYDEWISSITHLTRILYNTRDEQENQCMNVCVNVCVCESSRNTHTKTISTQTRTHVTNF